MSRPRPLRIEVVRVDQFFPESSVAQSWPAASCAIGNFEFPRESMPPATITPMKTYSEATPSHGHDPAVENDRHTPRPRFTDQLPAIVLTAALIIGATAWMRVQDEVRRAEDLKSILSQNEVLRAQADDNRRQTEATARLLKEAMTRHDGEVFRSEEEVQKLNT